jgi:hypothetical protein
VHSRIRRSVSHNTLSVLAASSASSTARSLAAGHAGRPHCARVRAEVTTTPRVRSGERGYGARKSRHITASIGSRSVAPRRAHGNGLSVAQDADAGERTGERNGCSRANSRCRASPSFTAWTAARRCCAGGRPWMETSSSQSGQVLGVARRHAPARLPQLLDRLRPDQGALEGC